MIVASNADTWQWMECLTDPRILEGRQQDAERATRTQNFMWWVRYPPKTSRSLLINV